jgi:signal transduction histidine kinase
MLVFGVEERVGRALELRPGDAAVGIRVAMAPTVRTVQALLPETRTLHIVLGDSPLERFWVTQVREELAPFEGRLRFEWLNRMPFPRIREHVASLTRGDAVLYLLMNVDAAGTPLDHHESLREIREASAVPVFGLFESELGHGIVGGPLTSPAALGYRAADSAIQIMSATSRGAPDAVYLPQAQPRFDARELARFSIPDERLPAGSVVEFQPLSLWREHQATMIAVIAVVLMQAMLILALIRQHRRLQRAEQERMAMNDRLFTAHEDERRRLARELHDDVTQRLARLAIDAAHLEQPAAPGQRTLHGELARLGEDVHALSYRLHPSILDDLGLAEALKAECEQITRHQPLNLEVDVNGVPGRLSSDAALCVFRVAQEALRNVARHARAAVARVSLRERDGGVVLTVSDDGVGFDSARARERPSLGLAGMRERVRLIGGQLDVDSVPGAGTRVVAWVPLAGTA